jgi:hypothetical protein
MRPFYRASRVSLVKAEHPSASTPGAAPVRIGTSARDTGAGVAWSCPPHR